VTRAYTIADGTGQWFVIDDCDDRDEAQTSGRWIKTQTPVRIKQ